MSIYTDYLNTHTDIDYKDFLKVCAWNVNALKAYAPAELAPISEKIPLNITGLNSQLDAALQELQDLEAMSPEDQAQLLELAFDDVEDEHWSKINEFENLISVYGAILSDLCRWNPANAEMKALKAFAIKELQGNMPDLSKYSVSPVKPTITSYVDGLRKTYNANISALTKEITAVSKANIAANDYIDNLFTSLEEAPPAEQAEPAQLTFATL